MQASEGTRDVIIRHLFTPHRSITNLAGRPNGTYAIAFCRKRRPMEAACIPNVLSHEARSTTSCDFPQILMNGDRLHRGLIAP
jgi:hypothetical protein